MEVEPEGTEHEMFMTLTKNAIRSDITILSMERQRLKDHLETHAEGKPSPLTTGRLVKS